MARAFKDCQKDTGLNEDTFKKVLLENKIDENAKKYNLCLLETVEIMDKNGNLNKEIFFNFVKLLYPLKLGDIIEKCGAPEGPDPLQIGINLSVCAFAIIISK